MWVSTPRTVIIPGGGLEQVLIKRPNTGLKFETATPVVKKLIKN
jgi:hypothetical protein